MSADVQARAAAPLRIVLVDDEPLIREGLRDMLAAEAGVDVVAACADGPSAVAAVRDTRPDVLFLDVQMPGMDGLAVVRAIGALEAPPAVVFATAHDSYALAAFEASAVDYLLKPFDEERVRASLRRVRERLAHAGGAELRARLAAALASLDRALAGLLPSAAPAPAYAERLLVGVARGTRVVAVGEVEWIAAADNYAAVHTAATTGLLRESLASLEARLDPARFARVHRSAIVNLARVGELRPMRSGDCEMIMRSGAVVTLSRTYRDAVIARLR